MSKTRAGAEHCSSPERAGRRSRTLDRELTLQEDSHAPHKQLVPTIQYGSMLEGRSSTSIIHEGATTSQQNKTFSFKFNQFRNVILGQNTEWLYPYVFNHCSRQRDSSGEHVFSTFQDLDFPQPEDFSRTIRSLPGSGGGREGNRVLWFTVQRGRHLDFQSYSSVRMRINLKVTLVSH